jgi:hypothetical protein
MASDNAHANHSTTNIFVTGSSEIDGGYTYTTNGLVDGNGGYRVTHQFGNLTFLTPNVNLQFGAYPMGGVDIIQIDGNVTLNGSNALNAYGNNAYIMGKVMGPSGNPGDGNLIFSSDNSTAIGLVLFNSQNNYNNTYLGGSHDMHLIAVGPHALGVGTVFVSGQNGNINSGRLDLDANTTSDANYSANNITVVPNVSTTTANNSLNLIAASDNSAYGFTATASGITHTIGNLTFLQNTIWFDSNIVALQMAHPADANFSNLLTRGQRHSTPTSSCQRCNPSFSPAT